MKYDKKTCDAVTKWIFSEPRVVRNKVMWYVMTLTYKVFLESKCTTKTPITEFITVVENTATIERAIEMIGMAYKNMLKSREEMMVICQDGFLEAADLVDLNGDTEIEKIDHFLSLVRSSQMRWNRLLMELE